MIKINDINELEKIFDKIYQPITKKLIQYNLEKSLDLWREKYSLIKDSSWPSCNLFEDFYQLPKIIQDECINVHQFFPDLWQQQIIDDAKQVFTLPPLPRQKKIVASNLDIIVDKNIVDFACNHGGYTFASYEAGASSVIGFDIRDDNLKMATAIQTFLKLPVDKIKFIKLDIHNYDKITELCRNKDTALVPGLMYHVHDHYQILLSIAASNIPNILIETGENSDIVDSKQPLIRWRTEPTFENISGWVNDQAEISVGYPNSAWFTMVMTQLGYKLTSSSRSEIFFSKNHPDEFKQIRSVYVFKKSSLSLP